MPAKPIVNDRLTVPISPAMHAAFRKLAAEEGEKPAVLARRALREFLDRNRAAPAKEAV